MLRAVAGFSWERLKKEIETAKRELNGTGSMGHMYLVRSHKPKAVTSLSPLNPLAQVLSEFSKTQAVSTKRGREMFLSPPGQATLDIHRRPMG